MSDAETNGEDTVPLELPQPIRRPAFSGWEMVVMGESTSDVRGLVGVRDAGGAHPRPRNRAMGRQIDASSERFLTVMDREG